MSTTSTSELVAEERPHFGEAYQGARKAYGLASALLVAWELIGIEFGASPMESFNITLKSPQAVPYVLTVLIFYFSFRFTVEWYQSDQRRRAMRVSRVDYLVAHLIGVSALTLYAYQALRKVQVVDLIDPKKFAIFTAGLIVGVFVYTTWGDARAITATFQRDRVDGSLLIVGYIGALAATIGSLSEGSFSALFSGAVSGIGAFWIISLLIRWLFKRRRTQSRELG